MLSFMFGLLESSTSVVILGMVGLSGSWERIGIRKKERSSSRAKEKLQERFTIWK